MDKQGNQQNWMGDDHFPEHLKSYDFLTQHLRAQLEVLNTTEKGSRFVYFTQRLIPQTELGADYYLPALSEKKSHDEGVDLIAENRDGQSKLYIQAKLWVDRTEDIDTVLSKFQNYLRTNHLKGAGQTRLFLNDEQQANFLLVTLSPLQGLIKRYEDREFASKDFYNSLKSTGRINFIDGHQILPVLRAAYGKLNQLPTNLTLNLEVDVIQKDNVYIGIISSTEIQSLHNLYGDALFFENVRDFLGIARERSGRTTPNEEIVKTITNDPGKMLERNNGIVFRAEKVNIGDSQRQLLLDKGSIVNGCQTTMCIVSNAKASCFVPVKIVQTADSWDIAKAANFQNYVFDIDLELARNLRPQLAKRAAAISGTQLDHSERSAFQILEAVYERKVTYSETRLLYIALFSATPNTIFTGNYTELKQEVINCFYKDDPYGEKIFETLFALQNAAQLGLTEAYQTFVNPAYADLFKRLYKPDSPSYRCFLTMLALCGAIEINIAERASDVATEYERMKNFLSQARSLLENRRDRYVRYFKHAVKLWMQEAIPLGADESEIRRDMSIQSRRIDFTGVYLKLSIEADADEWLQQEKQQHLEQETTQEQYKTLGELKPKPTKKKGGR
jgi:hypothetical protein